MSEGIDLFACAYLDAIGTSAPELNETHLAFVLAELEAFKTACAWEISELVLTVHATFEGRVDACRIISRVVHAARNGQAWMPMWQDSRLPMPKEVIAAALAMGPRTLIKSPAGDYFT
jgi:hypothetical protein